MSVIPTSARSLSSSKNTVVSPHFGGCIYFLIEKFWKDEHFRTQKEDKAKETLEGEKSVRQEKQTLEEPAKSLQQGKQILEGRIGKFGDDIRKFEEDIRKFDERIGKFDNDISAWRNTFTQENDGGKKKQLEEFISKTEAEKAEVKARIDQILAEKAEIEKHGFVDKFYQQYGFEFYLNISN